MKNRKPRARGPKFGHYPYYWDDCCYDCDWDYDYDWYDYEDYGYDDEYLYGLQQAAFQHGLKQGMRQGFKMAQAQKTWAPPAPQPTPTPANTAPIVSSVSPFEGQ